MKNLEKALLNARNALALVETEIAEAFAKDILGPEGALLVRRAELEGGIEALETALATISGGGDLKALLDSEESYFRDVQARPELWAKALDLDWVQLRRNVALLRQIVSKL